MATKKRKSKKESSNGPALIDLDETEREMDNLIGQFTWNTCSIFIASVFPKLNIKGGGVYHWYVTFDQ